MKLLYLIKYGELSLKKKNRKHFENRVITNCMKTLSGHNIKKLKLFGRFMLEADIENEEEGGIILEKLTSRIFGIARVSPAVTVDNNYKDISAEVIRQAGEYMSQHHPQTFKVKVKRPFKNIKMSSMKMAASLGGDILDKYPGLKVDLTRPDMTVYAEILQDFTAVYSEKYNCLRGLPAGSAGKAGLLLSGGIDSPVAGYLAQKRGCYLNCIYFHSPPHTSQKAKDKVFDLARKLKEYQPRIRIFTVNFTEIQLMLKKFTDQQYFVILGRRMMMRIANRLAVKYGFKAFVTGESLGQVSSQTLENLHCTNSVADIPILRPLITFDKEETIEIAERIGTYDISILPYDDCCTLFLPPNPNTKAKVKYLQIEESKLDIESLADRAFETAEITDL